MTQVTGPVIGISAGSLTGAQARTAAAPSTANTAERAELAKAAKAFEAIFVRKLMGNMRQAGLGDELTGSSAVDQFRELSDAKMAENMADKGGLGIAELLLSQLDKKP
jgi:flagellar protein FlgJ